MNNNDNKAYINKAYVDLKNMGIKSPILELTKEDLENGVRSAVIREVLFYTYQPIKEFIQKYANIFKNIKSPKTGQIIPFTVIEEIILKHTFVVLKDVFNNNGGVTKLQKELMSIFLSIMFSSLSSITV